MEARTLVQPEVKPQPKGRKLYWALLILICLAVAGVTGVSANVGWKLTHPVRAALTTTPQSVGLNYQDVQFVSRGDQLDLQGWFIPAAASSKTVIFAHGYRKNRLQEDVPILPIAANLHSQGYNVLMFDFRNSGESEGELTSVGQYEVQDLLGAVDFIRSQPGISQQIVLFGFSMGASTAIIAGAREPAVTALIADAPFADLKTYLNANLSVWTELPSFPFNQAFFMVVPTLTGLQMESVSPIKEVNNLNGRPLLLIHGEGDVDIPVQNSESLVAAYPQAQLVRVPGAAHVKSYATDSGLYLSAVDEFLQRIKL